MDDFRDELDDGFMYSDECDGKPRHRRTDGVFIPHKPDVANPFGMESLRKDNERLLLQKKTSGLNPNWGNTMGNEQDMFGNPRCDRREDLGWGWMFDKNRNHIRESIWTANWEDRKEKKKKRYRL